MDLRNSEQLLRVFFSTFVDKKKIRIFLETDQFYSPAPETIILIGCRKKGKSLGFGIWVFLGEAGCFFDKNSSTICSSEKNETVAEFLIGFIHLLRKQFFR